MRFIKDGPEVPDRLVHAHEDGNVVFFCGAGISYPAGLPGFDGLTTGIFEALGENPNAGEKEVIEDKRFDIAIGLLEGRIKQRPVVREKIREILTPKSFSDPTSTATHQALLTLAKCQDDSVRLVTTNFDRIFLQVAPSLHSYAAPLLPVPKKSRWNGLVYLHGLLPENNDATALNNLVVSSGDFGLAYLTERWASRFVSELFRNYVVCFVGYSVGDPVLRYMLDALAADRILGEESREVFAFGDFNDGDEDRAQRDWQSKGVVPILYPNRGSHFLVHETLKEWAEKYRDGITGKRAIIVHEASGRPSPIKSDGQVERVLWALMEPTGQSAKTFAELDPLPPIEWLGVLAEPRFTQTDLRKLGIAPSFSNDTPALFSLLDRLAPHSHSVPMSLVTIGDPSLMAPRLDDVMWHIARWLIRHLDKHEVLMWVIKRGCSLHPDFKDLIIKEINADTCSIPRSLTTIWRLICAGLATNSRHCSGMPLYSWVDQFKRLGWNITLKQELIYPLRPLVSFSESLQRRLSRREGETDQQAADRDPHVRDYVDWEICLRIGEHPWEKLREIKTHTDWAKVAVECLPDFTALLRDILELMAELEGASDKCDLSYTHRPSITDHEQNNDYHEWTILIELCRDAWLSAAAQNPPLAKMELVRWKFIRYPLFRRLEFFASSETTLVLPTEGLALLLQDDGWWIWSSETQREYFRLLLRLGPKLGPDQTNELLDAILAGPPRSMYRVDLENSAWIEVSDHSIWLQLQTLESNGCTLTTDAKQRLLELSAKHPQWQLQADERDHFPAWMESGDGRLFRQPVKLPRELDKLVDALAIRPNSNFFYEDDWRDICQTTPDQAIKSLRVLATNGGWNIGVWREALQVFAESDNLVLTLSEIGPCLLNAPNETIRELRHSYAWWLKSLAKAVPPSLFEIWFQLTDRIFENADIEVDLSEGDSVGRAINNPVGHATEAILNWWYRTEPKVGSGLPELVKARLTRLANPTPKGFVHGRVMMAAHLASLHSADSAWAANVLFPYFDWGVNPAEAQGAWEGYLWMPRINAELLDTFKTPFLETARHYTNLGKHDKQYASLLTIAALEFHDHFSISELRDAFNALPKEGLAKAAKTLARSLGSAGDRRADYWTHRIKPLIETVWPKSYDKRTGEESAALMELCIHADSHFQEAFTLLKSMLVKTKHFYMPVKELAESKLATKYPSEALSLLNAVVDQAEQWPSSELGTCLEQISSVNSNVSSDAAFQRLRDYLNRYGQA
ncbi:MAG: anti-phage defense-associated sirtuin Dsr1 [Nitrospiraceae bacterium]